MNENISFLYIVYQAALMISALLGTGTIFLMIVGALHITLQNMPTNVAFILNLIPLIIFIMCCFWTSSDTQVSSHRVLGGQVAEWLECLPAKAGSIDRP